MKKHNLHTLLTGEHKKPKKLHPKKMQKTKHKYGWLKMHPDCKFCHIIHEHPEKIVFENEHIIVVFGRLHHKGHLVILTRTHEEHLMMLHDKTLKAFFDDSMHVCQSLHKAFKFDRLNLEYLDNWDPHIHWNVYPRSKSDPDWGNPPEIPHKHDKYKPKKMSRKEMLMFIKELKKKKGKIPAMQKGYDVMATQPEE